MIALNQLALCQVLPRGTRLNSHIPQDLYKKLETKMSHIRDSIRQWIESHEPQEDADKVFMRLAGDWQRKRPIWIMLMLSSLSLDGIKNREIPILDLYLAQEALKASKPLGVVEKAVEQCRPMNLLNETHVLYLLDQALDRLDQQKLSNHDQDKSSIKNLIEHYNCGSLDEKVFARDSIQIPDLAVEDARNESGVNTSDLSGKIATEINDYLRYELLTKRNIRMAQRVVGHLESQPGKSIFFAFGAAHFLGENDSVVSLVRQAGYKVVPVLLEPKCLPPRKNVVISGNPDFLNVVSA
uniref:Metalloprotease TIKI homolog n=1 Tax=Romanomermis culicivorax TaxID=13658 RepID=A0A915IUT0_ROMCU